MEPIPSPSVYAANGPIGKGDPSRLGRSETSDLRWFTLGVVLILTVGYLALAGSLNIWRDEYYTLRTIDNGPVQATARAIRFEEQPPLYFAIASLWQSLLGGGIFGVRALSVSATIAWLCVFYAFVRRLGHGGALALCLLLVVALHPTTLWMATEARGYALWTLVVLANVYVFVTRFLLASPRSGDWVVVAGTATAAMLTQPFSAFVLFSELVALALKRRWRTLFFFAGLWAGVVLLVTPVYAAIFRFSTGAAELAVGVGQWQDEARQFVSRAIHVIVPGNLSAWSSHRGVAALALGSLWLVRGPRWARSDTGSSLIVVLVGFETLWFVAVQPVGLSMLALARYGTALLPIYYLVLAGGLPRVESGECSRWHGHLAVMMAMALAIVPVTWTSYEEFHTLQKEGEWTRVARLIERNESPDQPIIVFRNEVAYPFRYHYSGINQVIPLPGELTFETFDPRDFALTSQEEAQQLFDRNTAPGSLVWLVTDMARSYRGVNFGHEYLESVIDRNTKIVVSRQFRGSRVRLVQTVPDDR